MEVPGREEDEGPSLSSLDEEAGVDEPAQVREGGRPDDPESVHVTGRGEDRVRIPERISEEETLAEVQLGMVAEPVGGAPEVRAARVERPRGAPL